MSRQVSDVDVMPSCVICCAVITTGTNGPVISWRAPDRRAKRKGIPESADDAKPADQWGGDMAAQLPAAVTPVVPRSVKPDPPVRATSNSSRYRGVTRHRRDGGSHFMQRAQHPAKCSLPLALQLTHWSAVCSINTGCPLLIEILRPCGYC